MPHIQLATVHRDGRPVTLADIAQFIAGLSAAGVPAAAVPVCSGSWHPDDPTIPTTTWPPTLFGCLLDDDETAALLQARAERGDPPADEVTRMPLDVVAEPDTMLGARNQGSYPSALDRLDTGEA